jgi:asparagine synthase (glutamine-hydrolysing)
MISDMAHSLTEKGVGPITTFATGGFQAAAKRLTADSPVDVSTYSLIDQPGGISCAGSVRIDNRRELAEILGMSGSDVTREQDLALVIAAYRRWGADCIARLYGDFAFALWDANRHRALCARDHVGIVPFYFARAGDILVFGNELAAVAGAPDISGEIDSRLVADFLDTELLFPPGRTMLKSVSRLRPGHRLEFSESGLKEERWWRFERIPEVRFDSDGDYVEALDSILARAVKNRLPAQGSVATHVTGGLDSSAVTAILTEQCRAADAAPPMAITWNPEPITKADRSHPEAAILATFCGALDLSIHRHPPDVESVLEFFARDPVLHPTSSMLIMEIPVQKVAHRAGCSTIFSGHGGDQGISYRGSGYMPSLLLSGDWQRLAEIGRSSGSGPIRAFARALRGLVRLVKRDLKNQIPFALGRSSGSFKRPSFCRFNPRNRFVRRLAASPEGARRNMLLDGYLDMRIEAWAEHGSRRGLRYVYPLLDRYLLEFALGLPPEMFDRGTQSRWLMRQMLRRHAPEPVAENRNKTEPTRSLAMVDALEEARPLLVKALHGELERGNMIDVASLRKDLSELPIRPRGNRSPRFGRRRAALEMLDIDPRV